jgi:small GTP-binding protein
MIGAFAVGKTSLVKSYIQGHTTGTLTDKYLTTVGVQVSNKDLMVGDQALRLMIWDMAGKDELQEINFANLNGASGYLLVADGTRRETVEIARGIQKHIIDKIGNLPFIFVVNKADLIDDWEVDDRTLDEFTGQGWSVLQSSAKTGASVEEAFASLAQKILEK